MSFAAAITGSPFGLYSGSGPVSGGGVTSLTAGNTALSFSAASGNVTATSSAILAGTVNFSNQSSVTVTLAGATIDSVVLAANGTNTGVNIVAQPAAGSITLSTADGSSITELIDYVVVKQPPP